MSRAEMACVVLASGLSKRFGAQDKLSADLCGRSVLTCVLDTASSVGFGEIYVVCQTPVSPTKAAAGFSWLENKKPEDGQGHALRLGLGAARRKGWDTCAVLLGDMPFVPLSHIKKLIEKSKNNQSVISVNGSVRLPPAVFQAPDIDIILSQNLGSGARGVFDQLNLTTAVLDAQAALDVDTPEDLARMVRIMKASKT